MRQSNLILAIIIITFSCNKPKNSLDRDSDLETLSNSSLPPKKVKLNLDGGYYINQLTGDSIQPIINLYGDTVRTGVPIRVHGRVIPPNSVAKPKIIPAGKPKVVPTHLNVQKIPEELTVIPVNKGALKTFTPGVDTSSFVLVNSTGDTIHTGVPIPANGKLVRCIQPQPVKALLPRMKDNANMNMKYLDVEQGMNNSYVISILEDSHGNLWFGTWGGGVNMYNGETFTHYTEREGLSNNFVWSIVEDSNSNIWLGTEKGLNLLMFGSVNVSNTKNSLSASGVKKDSVKVTFYNPVIHTYSEQDGLKGIDFYGSSVLLDSKNRIWWGSGKSLIMLDMNNFKIPIEPPTMQLNGIEINKQFADYRHLSDSAKIGITFDSVARFNNYPLNLELSHNRNHITFHFSAIDWSAPHKIKYSYKMEGDNWSLPAAEAKADYSNLPYGTYTFKVHAIGGAQKWSETFEYSFIIHPPWWHTWWARSTYGILAFLMIIGIVRLRTRTLEIRQKQLENEVENRTMELKNTQTQLVQSEKMASLGQLTAGVAHEINNPINFVNVGSEALKKDVIALTKILLAYSKSDPNVEDLKKELEYDYLIENIPQTIDDIQSGGRRTAEIVKSLRVFSLLDEAEQKFADIHENLDSTLLLRSGEFNKGIELMKNYDKSIKAIECFPSQLNQVFLHIINNAIESMGEEGTLTITTKNSSDHITIGIKDTGPGIPNDIQKKVFDPFFTTKDVGKGTGLGLAISFGIIKKHRGTIEVKSEEGVGTEFVITLPISFS